jgi:cytochrome c peroxidase
MTITGNPADSLKFKVPSLRNVTLTFPYMHDGRFNSPGKVIDHYRSGIDITQPTVDTLLKKRIAISNQEKIDLLSFLLTLKDEQMIHDPRFQQPD